MEQELNTQSLDLLVDNTITGLPEPIQVPTQVLHNALVKNPSVLVGALTTLLSNVPKQGGAVAAAASNSTPITAFYPASVEELSPAAKKLTRGDLMALAGWGPVKKTPEQLGLSVDDVKKLRDAFGQQLNSDLEVQDVSVSCCCCSPCCCCAAAVIEPVKSVA